MWEKIKNSRGFYMILSVLAASALSIWKTRIYFSWMRLLLLTFVFPVRVVPSPS